MSKKGHANLHANKTKPDVDALEVAMIPLEGGSTMDNWKELPPLALRLEEWQEIGKRMNWTVEENLNN